MNSPASFKEYAQTRIALADNEVEDPTEYLFDYLRTHTKPEDRPFSPENRTRSLVLNLDGIYGQVRLEIEHRLDPKFARTVALSYFRQIRPWLEFFRKPELFESEVWFKNHGRDENRPLPDFKQAPLDNPAGQLGLRIRTNRLLRGWTLESLSIHSGITVPHLSSLERGLHKPYQKTIRKLEAALGVALTGPAPQSEIDFRKPRFSGGRPALLSTQKAG